MYIYILENLLTFIPISRVVPIKSSILQYELKIFY